MRFRWRFWKTRRILVTIFIFLGMICKYMVRGSFSVAVVAMTTNRSETINGETVQYEADFDWSSETQNLILSSLYFTYSFMQLPAAWVADKFGGNVVFGYSIGLSAFLYIFIPLIAQINYAWLIVFRIIQGIVEAGSVPSINILVSFWSPPSERNRILATAISGNYLGTLIGFFISGLLDKHIGWQYIFYIFGGISLVWFIGFCLIVRAKPEKDSKISLKELDYIIESLKKEEAGEESKGICDNLKVFKSLSIWCAMIAAGLDSGLYFIFLTLLPEMLVHSFGYDTEYAGFISALPSAFQIVFMLFGGQLADYIEKKQFLTRKMVRKFYISGTFIVQATLFIVSGYFMPQTEVIYSIVLALSLEAVSWTGVNVNMIELDPPHVATIAGVATVFGMCGAMLGPLIIGYVVDINNENHWRNVFYVIGSLYIFGALMYSAFGSTKAHYEMEKKKIDSIDKYCYSNDITLED